MSSTPEADVEAVRSDGIEGLSAKEGALDKPIAKAPSTHAAVRVSGLYAAVIALNF